MTCTHSQWDHSLEMVDELWFVADCEVEIVALAAGSVMTCIRSQWVHSLEMVDEVWFVTDCEVEVAVFAAGPFITCTRRQWVHSLDTVVELGFVADSELEDGKILPLLISRLKKVLILRMSISEWSWLHEHYTFWLWNYHIWWSLILQRRHSSSLAMICILFQRDPNDMISSAGYFE